jgi:transposase-like protein
MIGWCGEIITGRRRRQSVGDRFRLVTETNEPGALIRAVAAWHGACESLLFSWQRQVSSRQGSRYRSAGKLLIS